MTQNLNLFIAFLAGVLSFLSPCVLPLIPSYLSLIGGSSVAEAEGRRSSRSLAFLRTAVFVAGFSAVFIALGLLFSGAGGLLGGASRIITLASGVLVIVLGLNFIFNFWEFLSYEKRAHLKRPPRGLMGSLLLGMAFGAGWTPCVGPILASILFLAGAGGRLLEGAVLLAVYSLGLGLPFLLAGLFFSQFLRQKDRLKRHFRALRIASGVFLVLIGVLILLGRLQRLSAGLNRLAQALQGLQESAPGAVQLVSGLVLLAPAVVLLAFAFRPAAGMPARLPEAGMPGGSPAAGMPARLPEAGMPARLPEAGTPAGDPKGPPRLSLRLGLLLGFALAFLCLSALTFAGVLVPSRLLSLWLAFQGI